MSKKPRRDPDVMETRKTIDIPMSIRLASFKPETFNDEQRTVDVVFSTGQRVKRRAGFFGEEFFEELSMKPAHIRLGRFNSGAPLLDNHRQGSVRSDVLGVIENARVKSGELIGRVRFSDREDVKPVMQDVKDGIIRNLSTGYITHRLEEVGESEGHKIMRATDWEPAEGSLVTVGADAGAQVRNNDQITNHNHCELILRGENLMEPNESIDGEENVEPSNREHKPPSQAQNVDIEKIKLDAVENERKRALEIRNAALSVGFDSKYADQLVDGGDTVDEARAKMIEDLAKKDAKINTQSSNLVIENDERSVRVEGIGNAILHRFKSDTYELTDNGRQYRNMSLIDIAREIIEHSYNRSTRGFTRDQVIDLAMDKQHLHARTMPGHTTSDFPEILANVANKTLRDSYEASPQVFAPFTRSITTTDFKEISRIQLGDGPNLVKVEEGGEVTRGTIGEQAEKYSIETFERIVTVSRKALINDDLDAFTRIPELFGRAARDLESDLVWGVITDNAALSDSIALFDAAHNNLNEGGAAAIAIASIGAARAAMRNQVGLGGRKLNIRPTWLFVPPALETIADQFVTNITPDQAGNVNPFAARLRVGVEPRLEDTSATRWYLTADTGQLDIVEIARLQGEEGPAIETRNGFDVEGVEIKARMDVQAKAIDFRGLQRNNGA